VRRMSAATIPAEGLTRRVPGRGLPVYLAADFARKDEVNALADELTARLPWVEVTSTWHTLPPGLEGPAGVGIGGPLSPELGEKSSQQDLGDIDRCRLFCILTTGQLTRGGRHFETGYAHANSKKVAVIGPPELVFHFLPSVLVLGDDRGTSVERLVTACLHC
jgi:hypothetical protein